MERIDGKYRIEGKVLKCDGTEVPAEECIIFRVHDKALVAALKEYVLECEELNCDREHIDSAYDLTSRVVYWQHQHPDRVKLPDTTKAEICLEDKVETRKVVRTGMHYKNGREAKIGDPIVGKTTNGRPVSGILIEASPGSSTCNGYVAPVDYPVLVTLGDCLHIDDFDLLGNEKDSPNDPEDAQVPEGEETGQPAGGE